MRVTHWLTVVAFFALLITGLEIVVSHPRFYWGETGNGTMRPLFTIPIPSSRDTVPTGYRVLPDQNDGDLPVGFGGPLRLRVPRQLGYKSVKYINHITATDSLKRFGKAWDRPPRKAATHGTQAFRTFQGISD